MTSTKRPVYMAVTRDKYELPFAVADSMCALARLTGTDVAAISRSINNKTARYRKRYVRVYLSEKEFREGALDGKC